MMRAHRNLALVKSKPLAQLQVQIVQNPIQETLFHLPDVPTAWIVNMPFISDNVFSEILKLLHPSLVFDLRTAPTFRVGRLNRSVVFTLFKKQRIIYYDIPGMFEIASRGESDSIKQEMYKAIAGSVKHAGKGTNSIMILIDDEHAISGIKSHLPGALTSKGHKNWIVQLIDINH